jgi:hypothetical protein
MYVYTHGSKEALKSSKIGVTSAKTTMAAKKQEITKLEKMIHNNTNLETALSKRP